MNSTEHDPKCMGIGRPRTFDMLRLDDATGISGTGHIAEGVVFGDGTAVLRWLTEHRSTAIYESARELLAIHGHGGKTEIRYHAPLGWGGSDGRACSNCAHAWEDHCLDGASICCAGGCSCCLLEHPEFKPLGKLAEVSR